MSLLVGETAVSVKLRDDGFQRQLVGMVDAAVRAANGSMERLGESVRPVSVAIDDAQVKAFVESLARPIDTSILPTVDDAQAKAILDQFGQPIETHIQALVDGERARAEIGDLTKAWDATMTVIVDDAAARAARADLERPIEPVFQPVDGSGGASNAANAAAKESGGGGGGLAAKVGGLAAAGPEALVAGLTVATLVGLTKAGADYQTVLTQIKTAATALPEDAIKNEAALAKLRPTVTALGNDLELPGQSAADAADAINVLVRANYPLADAEALARNALQLSIVTKQDAAASTTLLTDTMASSGLAATDATFAIDRLAMSEVLGKGKVADLAESVKYAGTGFQALYGDTMTSREAFEKMLGTLLVFDQAGVRGSLAGTELNRMMTDLATPTGKANTQLNQLTAQLQKTNPEILKGGTVTRDASGHMREVPEIVKLMTAATKDMDVASRDAALATVFTTNGLRAFQIIAGQGADTVDQYTAKLGQADGAGKKLAEGSASDLSKAIENFGSTLSTVSNDLVAKLSPAITTGLTAVTNGIGTAGTAILTEMEPGKFQTHMAQVGEVIAKVVGPETIAKIQGYIGQIGPTFQSGFETVKTVVSTVVGIVSDLWDRFGQTLINGLKGAVDSMMTIASGFMTLLKGVFDTITAVLHGDWAGLWEGIKEILRGAWQIIVGIIDAAWNVIKTAFGVALGLISAAWSAGWHALHTLLTDVWTGIKKAVSNGIDDVVGFLKTLPGKAVSAVGNVASTLLSAGRDLIGGFKTGVEEIWKTVSTWLGTLGRLTVSAIGSLAGTLTSTGRALLQGMRTGAEEVWNSFYAWLKTLPGKAVDAVASIPGKIGGALGDGLGWVAKKFADGGLVTAPTYALIGEAGPEAVLPLGRPDRMRHILSDRMVASTILAAMPSTDRSLLSEMRRMRGAIAELQASNTTVVVPDPAMLHIYARAQADATTRRLRRAGG